VVPDLGFSGRRNHVGVLVVGAGKGGEGWSLEKRARKTDKPYDPLFSKGAETREGGLTCGGNLEASCPKRQDQRGILQQNVASGAGIGDANHRNERAKRDAFCKEKNRMFRPVSECCKEENASH